MKIAKGSELANQWGRDSDFRSGRKGASAAGIIIAVVFSLLVGAAGGYAAFRFTQPDTSAAVATAVAARSVELEAKIAQQAGELDALAEKLAAASLEAPTPEDLSSVVEALTGERDALAAENGTLKANLATAEAERDAARQDVGASEASIAAELARLQNEVVPELTAERDQLKRKTMIMLADQGALKARAKVAADTHTYDARRIADLQARLADAEQELAASQDVLDALKLEKRTDKTAEVVVNGAEIAPAEKPNPQQNPAPDLRKPDDVAQALRTAPGLGALSEADRQKLTDTLIAGECVTTALKSVFERVPILTLRNLIRDLNSDC